MKNNSILKYIIISIFVAIFCEIFIFNYQTFFSYNYIESKNEHVNVSGSMICDNSNYCILSNTDTNYLEIKDINKKINNIYLDLDGKKDGILDISVYLTDEANQEYFKAGTRKYSINNNGSNYIKVHTNGKTSKIKIIINKSSFYSKNDVASFKINSISFNKPVNFHYNYTRTVIVTLFMFFICIFNIKSSLNKIKKDDKKAFNITIIAIAFLALLSALFVINNPYGSAYYKYGSAELSYQYLSESFAKGQININLPVSEKLLNLNNPYDSYYRAYNLSQGKDFYWDYSFYNGKYYCYYGVVPCILLYFPYYLITGHHIGNGIVLIFSIITYICGVFFLLWEIVKKYFKNVSFFWYLLLSFFVILTSGLAYAFAESTFYYIPVVMGVAFTMIGAGFWLKAINDKCINKKYLVFGSIFMALVAGCRPQLLLLSSVALIIFYKPFKDKKNKLKEIISFATPYIIIGILLMIYNYVRFGSIFDFGANYNLTTNDMTRRGFVLGRIIPGLYSSMFESTRISSIFPFINSYEVITSYVGSTVYEKMVGGFFFTNVLASLSLLLCFFKKEFNNKKVFNALLFINIIAFVISILDIEMAGILYRYILDYGFIFTITTSIIIMQLIENNNLSQYSQKIIIALVFIAVIYGLLSIYTNDCFTNFYPNRFYDLYYMFMFWL